MLDQAKETDAHHNFETLHTEREGDHVLVVTLNRLEAANAMNTQMGADLMTLFEQFSLATGDTRCIVRLA